MSNTAAATKIARSLLEPILLAEGFEGRWPAFHRAAKRWIETVRIDVSVRAGVVVTLGSLPPRATLGSRTAASDVAASSGTGARRAELGPRAWIRTPADMRALATKLGATKKRLRDEGAAFWAAHAAESAARERYVRVQEAVATGEPRRLRAALASMSRREAQAALDALHLWKWAEAPTLERLYPLADVVLDWRPPWMLAAALAAQAARVLARPRVLARQRAKAIAILGWMETGARRPGHLAGQVSIYADAMLARREVTAGLRLYEHVVGARHLRAPCYGNALHAVLAATCKEPVDPARHRRFIRAALAAAPEDSAVHFNVACAYVELGDAKRARDHLAVALRLGADPKLVAGEPLLKDARAALTSRASLGRAKSPANAKTPRRPRAAPRARKAASPRAGTFVTHRAARLA